MSEGYYRSGISKLATNTFHPAIEDLRKSESYEDGNRESRNAGIPCGLGECYHQLKEYDQALSHYDQAVEMDEQNTEFLMHRAQCYYDLGQFDKSIEDLQKGL
jgi:tetratricopeptide (TPR) repeat protein